MANTGTYDNIILAGVASLTVVGIGGGSTNYIVYDISGNVIASGAVSGTSVTIPAPGGSWPPGHFTILFTSSIWNGSTGNTLDSVQVLAVRSGVGTLPSVPAFGTTPAAGDFNNRGIDQYMHGLGIGNLQRWNISDAANPTVPSGSTDQAGSIANIQAGISLEQGAGGYNNPTYADATRPRPQFVCFPNDAYTKSGYSAGVTSVVAALGPGTSYGVKYFEGLNEPSQTPSGTLTPAQSAAQFNAFAAAVYAGHANAKPIGPCEVSMCPGGADTIFYPSSVLNLRPWLAALTQPLGGASFHLYNGYNGDFLVVSGWLQAIRNELATAGLSPTLPIFLTENSTNFEWKCWNVQRMIQWAVLLYLTAERFGCPKENIYWFFDSEVGGFPPYGLKELKGELRPQSVFLRTLTEEVYGKSYNAPLDFGTIGNNFYLGNVYRGSSGTTVALVAQGNPSDTVTLAISDSGPITISQMTGAISTVNVVGGKIVVPISHYPVYVRLSAACTVSVADAGNGLIGATNIASTATVTSTGTAPGTKVNNGTYETGGYLPGPDYVYTSVGLPCSLTFTWGTTQQMKKILIRQVPPWENYNEHCSMIRGKLEYWTGAEWLPCPTIGIHWDGSGNYVNPTAHSLITNIGGRSMTLSYYDQQWNFNVDFVYSLVTTKLRWTVYATGYGDLPDKDTAAFYGPGFLGTYGENASLPGQRLTCSEIIVIQDGSTLANVVGAA